MSSQFLASVNSHSGLPARSIATTTFSLGRSDLETLDSNQASMGGGALTHPAQPSIALLQPLSRPLAYPVTPPQPSGPRMHPLFAYSPAPLHHAPIQYDVSRTPSVRTVLDSTTGSPVPAHILVQSATDPPILDPDELFLKSHEFPWVIVVGIGPVPTLRVRPADFLSIPQGVIKNLDVLYAIHTSLRARVSPREWEALGNGSREWRKVKLAHERRCRSTGVWDDGRRIDWLGGKNHLVGIELDGSSGYNLGKLVFAQID